MKISPGYNQLHLRSDRFDQKPINNKSPEPQLFSAVARIPLSTEDTSLDPAEILLSLDVWADRPFRSRSLHSRSLITISTPPIINHIIEPAVVADQLIEYILATERETFGGNSF
ncbi:MAG: hypothetical protein JKY67_21965 [Pseudomonadales bacterium]|nr:hypothetical protein [Pseudomonadales bacterium]